MKNYTKVFISFVLIINSIILTTFLWNKIYLPFKNPLEIIGEYSKQSYNPINDVLRYLIFIIFPLLVTLLCCNFFIKNSFRNIIKQIFQDDKTTINNEKSKEILKIRFNIKTWNLAAPIVSNPNNFHVNDVAKSSWNTPIIIYDLLQYPPFIILLKAGVIV